MKKMLLFGLMVLSICCSVLFLRTNLHAYPDAATTCTDCHALDPNITLTTSQNCSGGNTMMYHVDISGPYGGQKGWGLYQQSTNSWSGGYGGANFSLPVGTTAQFWGAQGSLNGTGTRSATEVVTAACAQCVDNDNDGYAVCNGQCVLPAGKQCGDCDDTNPAVHPGAVEGPYDNPTCSDGLDNNCNSAVDAADAGCAAPPSSDYDITGFTCTSKVTVGKPVALKVTITNRLTTDPGAAMTVYGNQGASNSGGTYIPIATNVTVTDPPGGRGTAYSFTYTPASKGAITWTTTVNDANPDLDQANCTTNVQ